MKRALASVLVAGLGLAAFSTASFAGQNTNAKILLHLVTKTAKAPACGNVAATAPACQGVKTNGALYPTQYYAYLLVTDGNASAGIGGLQCGIQYQGGVELLGGNTPINVYSWTNCATLEFVSTGWPSPGGGNLITWDASTKCQRGEPGGAGTGVVARAGYFYMAAYGPSTMAVTTRPVDDKLKVADCASNEDQIGGPGSVGIGASHMGVVNFSASGAVTGYNPCGLITPTKSTTWSGIKGSFTN